MINKIQVSDALDSAHWIGLLMTKIHELVDIINDQQERIEELENKVEQIMPTTS